MKRLAIISLAIVLAGCAPPASGTLGPAPTAGAQASTVPSASAPIKTLTIELWLTRGGEVFPTKRTRPYTLETSHLALTELFAGPTALEAAADITSAIPPGMPFDLKGISDGVAVVSFPKGFYVGATTAVRLRQAQVVYTLTQFPSVSRVDFQTGAAPLGRSGLADLMPPIVVLNPVIGQRVSSPIALTGNADTGQATVNARLLDETGHEIATKFATASCGNGCRGAYSMLLSYGGCTEQGGTLEVYQISGGNGSRQDVVAIPVVLSGC